VLTLPDGHGVHAPGPATPAASPWLPAAHNAQSAALVAPMPTPYVLRAQGVHTGTPVATALNVPFGHSCGADEPAGQNVPAPQTPLQVMFVAPGPPQRPAGHGTRNALDEAAGQ
jgi:hypothetical protein